MIRGIWSDFKGLIIMAVAFGAGYVAYLVGVPPWIATVGGICILAAGYAVFTD